MYLNKYFISADVFIIIHSMKQTYFFGHAANGGKRNIFKIVKILFKRNIL